MANTAEINKENLSEKIKGFTDEFVSSMKELPENLKQEKRDNFKYLLCQLIDSNS